MTTEPRGRGRPRQARVESAVLESVLDLVAESGLSEVTMDAVATRAGVSKPAIYRRWPGKRELLIAAAESLLGHISVPDLGDFRAELRVVLRARIASYRRPGAARLFAGLIRDAAEAGEERSPYSDYLARATVTRRIFERGIERGDVRADLDVDTAVTLLGLSLLMRLIVDGRPPDEQFGESVLDFIAARAAA